MWLFPCLLLTLVCHASTDLSSSLENQKVLTFLEYYDKYIYSPYIETEKETCEISQIVTRNMQNKSAPDIWDSVRTVSKQLDKVKTVVEGGENERCVQDIRNSWNDFVQQESNNLKQRLQSALIEQEKQQSKVSEAYNNYTLFKKNMSDSLERCSIRIPLHMSLCILEARAEFQNGPLSTFVVRGKITGHGKFLSPCMATFESSVLAYHSERSQRIIDEFGGIRANLSKCSSQSENSTLAEAIETLVVPAPLNSSSSIKLAQKLYNDALNRIWIALDSFVDIEIKVRSTFAEIYRHPETTLWKRPRRHYTDYVRAVDKILRDHPDLMSSVCSIILGDLEVAVTKGLKEMDQCLKTYSDITIQYLSEGREKFKYIAGLNHVGNVAILGCIHDAYTFRKNRTEECSILKFIGYNNTCTKVERELEDVEATINIYLEKKAGPPSSPQLCREYLLEKVRLRAFQVLYDFRGCLYRETEKEYNFTLSDIPTSPL